MLALRDQNPPPDKCIPNILPCRINHTGATKVTKRYWNPSSEDGDIKTAFFRGRKLRGKAVKLPPGYTGITTKSTDRVLSTALKPKVQTSPYFHADDHDSPSDIEEGEKPDEVKIMETTSTFDHLVVWGHDQVPAADDSFVKGIEEWITFASAIHENTDLEKQTLAG